jgi:predicted phage terminase large subunit-like protein
MQDILYDVIEEFEEREKSEKSLSEFIRQAWHIVEPTAPYVHGWHIDAMSEHLEAVTNGKIRRLLINVPPGAMKSLIVNVFWPAWEWGPKKMPHLRYLTASHSQNLAIRDNMRLRRLLVSDWYQWRYPHVVFSKDQKSKIKFENTSLGFSEAVAASSITGSRADRVKIDDPLSFDDAESETILSSMELWFKEAVPTRLVSPEFSAIILIMQRLHELDTSNLAIKMGYEHLMLPMKFETQRRCITSIGFIDPRKEEGELLFPERFPEHVVKELEKTLGPHGTACQNQQRPSPREGGIIKVEWLKNRFRLIRDTNGKIKLNEFQERYQSWDTAFKTGEENDYSVCTTWGLKDDGFYLIHRFRAKMDFPTLESTAIQLGNEFLPNQILIEDKASGQSLVQAFKRKTRLPVKAVKVDRDKKARLNAVSGYFQAQRIYLPEGESWVTDVDGGFIQEITTFPSAAHDDQVDSTTQFFLEIVLRRESSLTITHGSMIGR